MTDAPPPIGDNLPLDERLQARHQELFDAARRFTEEFDTLDLNIKDDAGLETITAKVKTAGDLIKKAADTHELEKAEFLANGRIVDKVFNAGLRDVLKPIQDALKAPIAKYLAAKEEERRQAAKREAEEQQAKADALQNKAAAQEAEGRTTQADLTLELAERAESNAQAAQAQASRSTTDLSRTHTSAGTASVRKVWKAKNIDRKTLDLEELRPYFDFDAFETALRAFIKAGNRSIKGAEISEDYAANVR